MDHNLSCLASFRPLLYQASFPYLATPLILNRRHKSCVLMNIGHPKSI